MKTIWKCQLEITDEQDIRIPRDAQLLSVAEQWGRLTIWFLVDAGNECVKRRILVIGTGNPIDGSYEYLELDFIGTAVMSNVLVWHVFDACPFE